jgi:protein dithiol oxidoreductase (disulfide-forming)
LPGRNFLNQENNLIQRREFSVTAACGALTAGLGLSGVSGLAQAQSQAFREGSDYLVLGKPAPTEAPAGKVEVVEFFWYGCPHCNSFEPQLEAWLKTSPKTVAFRRVPVSFRPDFEPNQRLYYTLEAMGKLDELHKKVFYTIHVEKQPLTTAAQVTAWAEKQGIDKVKFSELFNSFTVSTKVRKATQLQDSYQVDGVPALGVAGRYYTSSEQAKSMDRALLITNYLVGLPRKAA